MLSSGWDAVVTQFIQCGSGSIIDQHAYPCNVTRVPFVLAVKALSRTGFSVHSPTLPNPVIYRDLATAYTG